MLEILGQLMVLVRTHCLSGQVYALPHALILDQYHLYQPVISCIPFLDLFQVRALSHLGFDQLKASERDLYFLSMALFLALLRHFEFPTVRPD